MTIDETPEPPTNSDAQTIEDLMVVSMSKLERSHLRDHMPDNIFETIVVEAHSLIERRFASMQKLTNVSMVNLNPFLMLAMAPAYNIYSPFEAAEYLQYGKMPHGDSTAFGKFVEAKVFPLFGVTEPPEKKEHKTLFSSIDAEITVDGRRILTTWKSGPWTMNQSHAHEMSTNFPQIRQSTGCDILLGIFYGREGQLNNKPSLVRQNTGEYFHILVGSELWEFVTGVKDAHMKVLEAIKEAQNRFALNHGGKTFHEHMIEARLSLATSFRETFELDGTEKDMWEKIFERAF